MQLLCRCPAWRHSRRCASTTHHEEATESRGDAGGRHQGALDLGLRGAPPGTCGEGCLGVLPAERSGQIAACRLAREAQPMPMRRQGFPTRTGGAPHVHASAGLPNTDQGREGHTHHAGGVAGVVIELAGRGALVGALHACGRRVLRGRPSQGGCSPARQLPGGRLRRWMISPRPGWMRGPSRAPQAAAGPNGSGQPGPAGGDQERGTQHVLVHASPLPHAREPVHTQPGEGCVQEAGMLPAQGTHVPARPHRAVLWGAGPAAVGQDGGVDRDDVGDLQGRQASWWAGCGRPTRLCDMGATPAVHACVAVRGAGAACLPPRGRRAPPGPPACRARACTQHGSHPARALLAAVCLAPRAR